jgi:hypothetical protein
MIREANGKAAFEDRDMPPAWAAIGAPLVGVPLLVLLLTLMGPGETIHVPEPDGAARIEAVEALPADQGIEFDMIRVDSGLREG